MPSTDRAFRAFARASPGAVRAFMRATGRTGFGHEPAVLLDDPNLDAPPHPKEADLVLRVGERDIEHYECQGYRQSNFLDRVFFYHVALVVRHPQRRVRSTTIWTRTPTRRQRTSDIRRGDLLLHVTHVVLPEVPALALLADRETACFAPGAALGALSVEELCERAVERMGPEAPYEQRYLAAMVAASQGRYHPLVAAMERANMQPVMIEDLVDFGIETGIKRGIKQGREQGREEGREQGREEGREEATEEARRQALLDTLDARGFVLDPSSSERIAAEHDPELLRRWCKRAVTAPDLAAVFA